MLVAEVMLQQTQVRRVVPAWGRFMGLFPTPAALATAPVADVLRAWQGLGYNRRAVALWRTAGVVVASHGGCVPGEVPALRRLPGVGPYTAAAVAACAFGVPVAAVDTNLRRVIARVRLGVEPAVAPPPQVQAAADAWVDRADPGAWNQALMDLGREVCLPEPRCADCPLRRACRFRPTDRPAGGGPAGCGPAVGGPAVGGPAGCQTRRAQPFHGSSRQLRGRIVDHLRSVESATLAQLAGAWAEPLDRVSALVAALAGEGLVTAGPAALAGRPGGRVRLGA